MAVSVRYLVDDVGTVSAFYVSLLGFREVGDWAGAPFRMLERGDLVLWVSGPGSSAGRPMPDGAQPGPGGWNRFVIEVDDIGDEVQRLTAAGVSFRGPIVRGPGGAQAVLDDPAGNPVELFQPA